MENCINTEQFSCLRMKLKFVSSLFKMLERFLPEQEKTVTWQPLSNNPQLVYLI